MTPPRTLSRRDYLWVEYGYPHDDLSRRDYLWVAGDLMPQGRMENGTQRINANGAERINAFPTDARGMIGYNVYRDDVLLTLAPIAGLTYLDEGLIGDVIYAYSVTAVFDSGESTEAEVEILVPAYNPPRNLVVTSGLDTMVALQWDAPLSQTYGEIDSYYIYRDNLVIARNEAIQKTYLDEGLENATDYEYYVTAYYIDTVYDVDGESAPSNKEIGRPEAELVEPSAPSG